MDDPEALKAAIEWLGSGAHTLPATVLQTRGSFAPDLPYQRRSDAR